MPHHLTPEPAAQASTSTAAGWAAAIASALALLVLAASLDQPDDTAAAQATAEQLAWLQGVAHGERITLDALAPDLARCAASQREAP